MMSRAIKSTLRRPDGRTHRSGVYHRDYGLVNGLMVPWVVATRVEGITQVERIEIEQVAVNPILEDSHVAKLQ